METSVRKASHANSGRRSRDPAAARRVVARMETSVSQSLFDAARSRCAECGTEFKEPVSPEQVRTDWGDAADDEIAYACGRCAEEFCDEKEGRPTVEQPAEISRTEKDESE